MDDKIVEIYTDGACSPNPGPGGWGAVLKYGEHERDLYGGEPSTTTNNRMELMAPIQALESLKRRSIVRIYTDSTYVRNGITGWLANWKRNGWLTGAKQPVKNEDLWRRLEEAAQQHDVEWHWVKGHAGHPENERADRLAVKGAQEAGPPKAQKVKEKRPKIEIVGTCGATTKAGKPCPIGAGESGFCHVHDPALQCGGTKKNGERCGVATGGGRCPVHQ